MASTILYIVLAVLLFCFSFVLLFGAPYVPTMRPQVQAALDLLNLRPGQTMLELGCGDGKVLAAAAERGWRAVGYELNPLLALFAWLRTRRYGGRVRVVWGNYWRRAWPPADGIYSFILPRYMAKLDTKIMQGALRPVRLASFAFAVPGRRPVKRKAGVLLYEYHHLSGKGD